MALPSLPDDRAEISKMRRIMTLQENCADASHRRLAAVPDQTGTMIVGAVQHSAGCATATHRAGLSSGRYEALVNGTVPKTSVCGTITGLVTMGRAIRETLQQKQEMAASSL
jgi:hypothetical protein